MSDIRPKSAQTDDANQMQQQARARALEEEQRKQVTLQQASTAQHAAPSQATAVKATESDKKIDASHTEASRNADSARQFAQFSQTQQAHRAPHVEAAKTANTEETMRVSDLQRQRDRNIKG